MRCRGRLDFISRRGEDARARGRARGTGSGSEVTRTAELAAADILSFDRLDALARCQMDLHQAETPFKPRTGLSSNFRASAHL